MKSWWQFQEKEDGRNNDRGICTEICVAVVVAVLKALVIMYGERET